MAAASLVQVANMALTSIGELQLLDSFEEDTTAARTCKAIFDILRDEVLEANDWTFARRHATLALTTETRTNWSYVYSAPADCLVPRLVEPGVRPVVATVPFEFELNDGGTAMVLATNQEDAELIYTARVTNPVLWTSYFVSALAARLAIQLGLALRKSPQFGALLADRYRVVLASAVAMDRNRQNEAADETTESISVRG